MAAPLSWLKKITAEVPELNTIPLFGNAPPFDWHRFASLLAAQFHLASLSIHARKQEWREADAIQKGLGKQPVVYPIVVSPLGTVFWIMAQEDMAKLTAWLLKPKANTKSFTSELLQEGFYRFLLLEGLDALQGLDPLKSFTFLLSEEERPLEEKAFCLDIEIQIEHGSCWGRLALPAPFRSAWIRHFEQAPSEYTPTPFTKQLEVTLSIRTGSVLLSQTEWDDIKVGDFIALDRGSYDPRHHTGAALLCLGATPLFNVKLQPNKISIKDYAFYYEETMQSNNPPPAQKAQPAEGEVVSIKELPLFVTVEVARLQMTLDQLMHLNPGNTLELPIHPDQTVSLTVNGQKVGRAELVHLGDTVGLRILEIG